MPSPQSKVRGATLPAGTSVSQLTPEAAAAVESNVGLPQFTAELDEITDVMRLNPRITSVRVYDVSTGSPKLVGHLNRQGVLRSAGGPVQ